MFIDCSCASHWPTARRCRVGTPPVWKRAVIAAWLAAWFAIGLAGPSDALSVARRQETEKQFLAELDNIDRLATRLAPDKVRDKFLDVLEEYREEPFVLQHETQLRERMTELEFACSHEQPGLEELLGEDGLEVKYNERSRKLEVEFGRNVSLAPRPIAWKHESHVGEGAMDQWAWPGTFSTATGLRGFNVTFEGDATLEVRGMVPDNGSTALQPRIVANYDGRVCDHVVFTWPTRYGRNVGLWNQGEINRFGDGAPQLLIRDKTPGIKYSLMYDKPYTVQVRVEKRKIKSALHGISRHPNASKPKHKLVRLAFADCPNVTGARLYGLVSAEWLEMIRSEHREAARAEFLAGFNVDACLPDWFRHTGTDADTADSPDESTTAAAFTARLDQVEDLLEQGRHTDANRELDALLAAHLNHPDAHASLDHIRRLRTEIAFAAPAPATDVTALIGEGAVAFVPRTNRVTVIYGPEVMRPPPTLGEEHEPVGLGTGALDAWNWHGGVPANDIRLFPVTFDGDLELRIEGLSPLTESPGFHPREFLPRLFLAFGGLSTEHLTFEFPRLEDLRMDVDYPGTRSHFTEQLPTLGNQDPVPQIEASLRFHRGRLHDTYVLELKVRPDPIRTSAAEQLMRVAFADMPDILSATLSGKASSAWLGQAGRRSGGRTYAEFARTYDVDAHLPDWLVR